MYPMDAVGGSSAVTAIMFTPTEDLILTIFGQETDTMQPTADDPEAEAAVPVRVLALVRAEAAPDVVKKIHMKA